MSRLVRRSSPITMLLVALLLAFGCDDEATDPGEETFMVDATVQFVDVEGGCWTLMADDGTRYDPLVLPPAFQQDGLDVEALLRPTNQTGTLCQTGEVVELIDIEEGNGATG